MEKEMKMAGWACIVSAVTTLPLGVMGFIVGFSNNGSDLKSAGVILSFISLALFVYIFHSLKRLLNEQFNFHLVNTHITILIYANVAVAIISVAVTETDTGFAIMALIAMVGLGIVLVSFGITLMKLEEQLWGLLKPFCCLSIAQGICMASIILIPLGFLASATADVLLALIFFHVAEQLSVSSERNT